MRSAKGNPGTSSRTKRGSALSRADGASPYLGALAKIGETVWYVAIWREQWVAQLSLSAAALKCGVRDRVRDHIG